MNLTMLTGCLLTFHALIQLIVQTKLQLISQGRNTTSLLALFILLSFEPKKKKLLNLYLKLHI
ncbi:hypothetical protein HanIR_Chr04g0181771 [Helianthus annuus]|nr:hypothetical protein HanIR_Chr04g0181771 [Helianthus annuus]